MSRFSQALFGAALADLVGLGTTGAQNQVVQVPGGKQPGGGGLGLYKAIIHGEPRLGAADIHRPKVISPFRKDLNLPIVLWGNGGGANSSSSYARFLTEIASHGFLVVAIGPAKGAAKDGKGAGGKGG